MYYNLLILSYCLHISTQIFQDLNKTCIDPLKEVKVQKEKKLGMLRQMQSIMKKSSENSISI